MRTATVGPDLRLVLLCCFIWQFSLTRVLPVQPLLFLEHFHISTFFLFKICLHLSGVIRNN